MAYYLVIKNGTVVDGTGKKRYQADVAIQDGRVADIGKVTEGARRTIDAHGLVVAPGCEPPSSAVTALARTTAPAWRSAQTAALSRLGKLPLKASQPICVGMSLVSSRSFMATGMPSMGESGLPAFQRVVLASAAARAPVSLIAVKAFSTGSRAACRFRRQSGAWHRGR